jgi:hypothetical protein
MFSHAFSVVECDVLRTEVGVSGVFEAFFSSEAIREEGRKYGAIIA